jgi:hypothetical protein
MELIEDFKINAQARNIKVDSIGLYPEKENEDRVLQHFELITSK